jgi:hypothetical protein
VTSRLPAIQEQSGKFALAQSVAAGELMGINLTHAGFGQTSTSTRLFKAMNMDL